MTDALNQMVDKCRTYNADAINTDISEKYSKETIGKQLMAIYLGVIPEGRG